MQAPQGLSEVVLRSSTTLPLRSLLPAVIGLVCLLSLWTAEVWAEPAHTCCFCYINPYTGGIVCGCGANQGGDSFAFSDCFFFTCALV